MITSLLAQAQPTEQIPKDLWYPTIIGILVVVANCMTAPFGRLRSLPRDNPA